MAGFSPRACIPFKGTPAQGRPPLASLRVNTHTPRRAPFLSARQPWSRSSTSLEHPRSDSLPSPHALGGESRVEMGWKHWRGARGERRGRGESGEGEPGTHWRSTEPQREKQVPPTPRPSRRGGDGVGCSHPGLPLGLPGPTRLPKLEPGAAAKTPSIQESHPPHPGSCRLAAGSCVPAPRLRGGSRAVRGGRRTHRLLRALGAPPE